MQHNQVTFSIIVPVYNVQEHIEHCIRSILYQSYQKWELILVDDGSLDHSGKICDNFASVDDRIHVIHKKNEGVSNARNLGIRKANNDWIVFVDSDDRIELNCLEYLAEKIQEYDIDMVVHAYRVVYPSSYINRYIKGFSVGSYNAIEKNHFDVVVHMALDAILPGGDNNFVTVWGKCYKRASLIEYNISFDERLRTIEDLLFNLQCYLKFRRLLCVNIVLYNYYYNENSVCHNPNSDKTQILSLNALKEFISIHYDSDVYYSKAYMNWVFSTFIAICRLNILSGNSFKTFSDRCEALRNLRTNKYYEMIFTSHSELLKDKRNKIFWYLMKYNHYKTICVLAKINEYVKTKI